MNKNHKDESSSQQEKDQSQKTQTQETKMAENPDPRANENIKHSSFERTEDDASTTGSEITDGEAG